MLRGLAILVVALAGAAIGLFVAARTPVEVGPFDAELRVTPSPTGDTSVEIPPLGSLQLDTHDGPAHLTIQLGQLDQARTQRMISAPDGVRRAASSVAEDVIDGVIRAGVGSLGAAVLGAMVLAALVFRNTRRVAWAGGLALAATGASLGLAAATFRLDAIEEPRYEGLLVNAPALVGDVEQIADDYQRYTEQLQRMVSNVGTLYTAASTLEVFSPDSSMTRVLHVSDLHLSPAAWELIQTVVRQYDVDLIIDSGDIVDWGTGPESEYLDSISELGVPYVFVRGNHDSELTEQSVAEQENAVVLDDSVATVAGLTIAGIGDPRFTPDQRTAPHDEDGREVLQQRVLAAGERLATTVQGQDLRGAPVDIAVIHDPIGAEPLDGLVPLVLAGHRHERQVGPLVEPPEGSEPEPGATLLMVQGSTGGAGLRGLEGENPESLALSVLYFDAQHQLAAYDDIRVGGHGLSEASVQRTLVDPPPQPSTLD